MPLTTTAAQARARRAAANSGGRRLVNMAGSPGSVGSGSERARVVVTTTETLATAKVKVTRAVGMSS
jgi:hypothetical protein